MITNPTEGGLQAKQEEHKKEGRVNSQTIPSSSRQWSSFRNPRIVRVSRTFGGKDRHSKVCTVRGLRDRRIRLSVPTAVQLYDLQDKLGLSQPSKVVDWLLDATKEDIDKLPPLQMPPHGFGQWQNFSDALESRNLIGDLLLPASEPSSSKFSLSPFFPMRNTSTFLGKQGIKINDSVGEDGLDRGNGAKSSLWDINLGLRSKDDGKGKSIEVNEFQKIGSHYGQLSGYYSSLPQNPMNSAMSYNQWEPNSSLSLSQFGGIQPQTENFLHPNSASTQTSGSSSQMYFYPPTVPSLFPTSHQYPYFSASTENYSSPSQPILPTSLVPPLHLFNPTGKLSMFQSNPNTRFLHPRDDTQNQDDDQAD